MSRNLRIHNEEALHFVSFATVGWIDVFTRRVYKDILVDSLRYCQKQKGLEVFAWCIMSNHIHLIIRARDGYRLSGILRDLKRFTSRKLLQAIESNEKESRKNWMLAIFKKAGQYNSNNENHQFWRQDNQPLILEDARIIDQKVDYIHNNPVRAGFVDFPEDYPYSSAAAFSDRPGLLEVDPM